MIRQFITFANQPPRSQRADEQLLSGCAMYGRFIYGRIDDLWIFLRSESIDTLARLWSALGSAETWGELRESLGERVTGLLMETAEFDCCPGDQEPFIWTPTIRDLVDTWSADQLLRISASELPHLADIVPTPEGMRLLAQYLRASSDTESRIVLQLAERGCLADRNDALIKECLAVPNCPAEG